MITVEGLQRIDEGFALNLGRETVRARHVILATGAADIEPALPDLPDAVKRGLLRHCPVCDGYEVIGQRVAVIGSGSKLANEAGFLRDYSDKLSVYGLSPGHALSAFEKRELLARGVSVFDAPVAGIDVDSGRVVALRLADGSVQEVDTSVGAGHAALAATAVHHQLRKNEAWQRHARPR